MPGTDYFVHESAYVDQPCRIGEGTKIWHFSHVMKGAQIGRHCTLGQNVHVASGVVIGDNVKVQNNVSLYTGVVVEDDVFGATIGANATIVCGVELGRYCFVAAGAVVAKDVPDYALMTGVPAAWKGWISRHAVPLPAPDSEGIMVCPESGYRYRLVRPGRVVCIDQDEDEPLSADMAVGKVRYDRLKETS